MAGIPPTNPYNVSQLKAKLMRPALTSHYICDFTPPVDVRNWLSRRAGSSFSGEVYDTQNQELFQISCSDASLPGSSLTTNDVNDDYTGVTQKFAYRRLYDNTSDFTFYVDRNYKVISFFEGWLSYIVGEENAGGGLIRPNYFYRVRFPNQYRTDNLYITKFERDTGRFDVGRKFTYQFIGAYPISVNSMPVSYDQSQLLKCTVSFTYDRYVINKSEGFKSSSPNTNTTNPNITSNYTSINRNDGFYNIGGPNEDGFYNIGGSPNDGFYNIPQ